MRRSIIALLLIALLGFSMLHVARAQEDDVDVEEEEELEIDADQFAADEDVAQPPPQKVYRPSSHPLTDMPEASDDVVTSATVVGFTTSDLPIGKKLSVVCGFINNGDYPFNLTYAMGSINSPFQNNLYVQNFTAKFVNESVEAGQEATFVYEFMVAPQLEPMELQLALTVFYEDEEEPFSNTFYNETINFVAADSGYNAEFFIKVILVLSFAGLIAYFVANSAQSSTAAIPPTTAISATGGEAKSFEDLYLGNKPTGPSSRKSKSKSKGKGKGKGKK